MDDDMVLLALVQKVFDPYGCTALRIGPDAVAVKGDAREVGPSVVIRFPIDMPDQDIARISNEVTNKVRLVCRVLMDVDVPSPQMPR